MSNPRDRIEARLGLTGPPLQKIRDAPPQIPDHELVRRIGQGAYGEVWLARNALGTWRAVKVVYRDNFRDERPYEREFAGIRRFEPLSRSNEGFVDILQVGRDEAGGWFYYVMELADDAATCRHTCAAGSVPSPEGEGSSAGTATSSVPETYIPRTLARCLHHRGRLPLDDCLQLGLTLTLALGHLHRHGLIHRDIKPSNIIYVGGVPKLADIGLVTEAQGANTFVGTEGFVPPEGPTSPQADLYALGKVLYEASMGKDRNEFPEPFTQIGSDRESVALMELNAVLLRACAPDPKRRYATAEEMHADLALLHSGGSVKRRHQFDRQFQIAKQVGTVATAATLLIGGAWLWQRQQTQMMARLAEVKAILATEKTRLADDLGKLDAENRNRIVRLDVANGMHLLDEGDPAGALLWFADALPLLTNDPAGESIHRIRIQQTLDQTPRVLRVFPHESGVNSAAFSPDGRLIMTATLDGNIRVWNVADGTLKWGPKPLPGPAYLGRFTQDGKRVILSSSTEQGTFNGSLPPVMHFSIRDAETGELSKWTDGAFEGVDRKLSGAYFSPDDRWLATAHGDGVICVFDMENGRRTLELTGHTDAVHFISFSADGRLLASASVDRTVRLWRLPTGEPVGKPLVHRWPAIRVLLTHDGQRAITAGWENVGYDGGVELYIWNTASGERLPQPIEVRDRIALFLAPGLGGPLVVQDRAPNFARAYSLATGKQASLDLKVKGIRSWDFTKDDSRLVLGLGDHVAQVFDMRTGSPLTSPFRHGGWGVSTVQFSPDGLELLTGCEDGNARLWSLRPRSSEVARGRVPGWLTPGFTFRGRQEIGRMGNEFPVHFGGRATGVFNDQLQLVRQFEPDQLGTDIVSPLRSPNGEFWAITVFDERSGDPVELRLGTVKEGDVQQVKLPHSSVVGDITFAPDSRYVISSCDDNRIRFWSTSDGSLVRTLAMPEGNPGKWTVISSDGRTALWQEHIPSRDTPKITLRFFDLDSGTFVGESYTMSPTVFYEVFSPSGEFVALMDRLGPVTILESRTGRLISSRIRHPGTLAWVHWDFGGRRLLTAGDNDEVLAWDVTGGGQRLLTLRTPGITSRTARWSPDGRFIVSNGDDQKVRVWDAATGEMAMPVFEHSSFVQSSFILNSNRLITVTYGDSSLRAWDLVESLLPPDVLADYAKLLSGRRLSATGALLVVPPEELAALNHSLRRRAPELFE